MPNRLFYTVKLSSKDLKENKYNLNRSFNKCLENGWVISLADSQVLRSIRDVTGKKINRDQLEEWYKERDRLKKKKNSQDNRNRIRELQQSIYNMMYIPEYITVQMETKKDYEKIYKNGFIFNGRTYRRFSCSASQARVSTIVFVPVDIKDELKRRLDNGRDLEHPLAPSKYNAYFGLYSSATKIVTTPRFCIIKDYKVTRPVDVDFIIETNKELDDIIEPRTMDIEFDPIDGSGLISPQMAEQWGKDLGEDYTPCQFCLRWSFTKGMVNEFDFVEWCKEYNNGNYKIQDIWGNWKDLREIDVILSEGQVKLWDSWKSQEDIIINSEKNGILWGITKYAPKKDVDVLITNYQFLQTLNLDKEQIKKVCEETINYIKGVSYDDIYYSLLFMLGEGMRDEDIVRYMESSDDYWLKSLILNHNLLNDKYSKEKIRELIIKKIEQACLGKLIVRGNFQCIVPDSFAFMQWITGQEVVGLLKAHEFYSQYWNNLGVIKVDGMRSPLTHFSEHNIMNLKNNELMKKWFKYSYSGIITNFHDEHTMNWAGSDYDFDILATTNNEQFINGKYPNQRVVTYAPKKPKKKVFTEDDLYTADTFSFGTKIGQITNCSTTFCALIPNFKEGSKERILLENRVKMCCGSQSRQIDKTKIGQSVKDIAGIWKKRQVVLPDDTPEQKKEKEFYNSILADKKPYFFKYKYKDTGHKCNITELSKKQDSDRDYAKPYKDLSFEEKAEMDDKKDNNTIISNCVMNNVCRYIESQDFSIKQHIKSTDNFDYTILLSNSNFMINKKLYVQLKEIVSNTFKEWEIKRHIEKKDQYIRGNLAKTTSEKNFNKDVEYSLLKQKLEEVCSNEEQLTNHLVYMFYVDCVSYNKTILWFLVGKTIYENIKNKFSSFYFPIKNGNGSLQFLFNKYSIERVKLGKEKEKEEEEENLHD